MNDQCGCQKKNMVKLILCLANYLQKLTKIKNKVQELEIIVENALEKNQCQLKD